MVQSPWIKFCIIKSVSFIKFPENLWPTGDKSRVALFRVVQCKCSVISDNRSFFLCNPQNFILCCFFCRTSVQRTSRSWTTTTRLRSAAATGEVWFPAWKALSSERLHSWCVYSDRTETETGHSTQWHRPLSLSLFPCSVNTFIQLYTSHFLSVSVLVSASENTPLLCHLALIHISPTNTRHGFVRSL